MAQSFLKKIIYYFKILIFYAYFFSIFGVLIPEFFEFKHSDEARIIAFVVFLLLAYPSYKTIKILTNRKVVFGFFWIGLFSTILLFSLSEHLIVFSSLEESSIGWRFRLLRGKVGKTSMLINDSYIEKFDPPSKARKDIQIIGIKTETLEKLDGKWPIVWDVYANVINKFRNTNNILLFDIFFLDEKEGEKEILSEAIKNNSNVLLDYSIEPNSASRSEIDNYQERLSILNQYKLKNVIDSDHHGISWLEFPIPPIKIISEYAAGLGFANIKKFENYPVRKMPLVAKIPAKNGYDYYPSIDLVMVCKYLGVRLIDDTEINFGNFIKIKNIPKKNINSVNGSQIDILTKPNPDREIIIPIDRYGQMEINYSGSLFSFKDEDIYDVAFDWDENKTLHFENNIFLVAMYYATGVGTAQDIYSSPYGEMSGIEHHAHTINTILNQDFLINLGKGFNLLILLFTAALLITSQVFFSAASSLFILIIIIITYIFLGLYLFSNYNVIVNFISVILNLFTIFISVNAYRIITEEENVKYIKSTFSKFVSKEVVDELLKNPEKIRLGGERREISVFFSDIRGFTTLSETLSAEELVSVLNEYLSTMTNSLIEYKGTIDKYMGDAIMAFWGAPLPLEEHAYYACIASLVQIEKLKILQKSWEKRKLPYIDIGIGLNTGSAVVGNMGSSYRMDYTCMGDSVNLGSRLEGSNKNYGTKIIISEYTYEKVKDKVYTREIDLVRVKGKNHPVRIYELLGLVNDADIRKYSQKIN